MNVSRAALVALLLAAFPVAPVGAQPPHTVVVSIVDSIGGPIAGAMGRVAPDTAYQVARDDGRLRLTSAVGGVRAVVVRALGYQPVRVDLDFDRPAGDTITVRLRHGAPATLDTTRVVAAATLTPDAADFEMRRRAGGGYVIDATQIERRSASRVTQLLRGVPGLRIERTSPTNVTVTSARADRGALAAVGQDCPLAWLVDGRVLHIDDIGSVAGKDKPPARAGSLGRPADVSGLKTVSIDDFIAPTELAAIEVYAGMNGPPAKYGHFACGAVLLWTKQALGVGTTTGKGGPPGRPER